MRRVIETGSDIATVCAFDPGALPEDFSDIVRKPKKAEFKQLIDEGQLWWHSTGGDGTYLFHVFVDEGLPSAFEKCSTEIGKAKTMRIPSGFLCVCGGEDVNDYLKRPQSRRGIELPAGNYSLRAWSLDWPEQLLAERCEQALGPAELKERERSSLAGSLYVAVTFITAFASLAMTIRWAVKSKASLETVGWMWAVTVLLVAVIPRLWPKPSKEELERFKAEQAILSEFPSFALTLYKAA
jgi:hypothetical protein